MRSDYNVESRPPIKARTITLADSIFSRRTMHRPRTALFHLQFCKNLSLLYDGTLQKEIYHHTKL